MSERAILKDQIKMLKDRMAELDQENRNLRGELFFAKESLRKIADPMKHHHWEEDPYTRAGCFQFVAHEALKILDGTIAEKAGGNAND